MTVGQRKEYRTRLFVRTEEAERLPVKPPYAGRGFAIKLRPFEYTGSVKEFARRAEESHHMRSIEWCEDVVEDSGSWRLMPELVIEARSLERAQFTASLITAACSVVQTEPSSEAMAVPSLDNLEGMPLQEATYALQTGSHTDGLAYAAAVAARCSLRSQRANALGKLQASLLAASAGWVNLHPSWGEKHGVVKDPIVRARVVSAITAAYSTIEELGYEVRASQKNPSRLENGELNPEVVASIEARLSERGLDPKAQVVWVSRFSPHLIERRYRLPPGVPTSWTRGPVRDRLVSLPAAIIWASTLRSRIAAHGTSRSRGTTSLRLPDALNVQMLARRLLLQEVGLWIAER